MENKFTLKDGVLVLQQQLQDMLDFGMQLVRLI